MRNATKLLSLSRLREKMVPLWMIVNIFLYSIFVIIIICYEFLVGEDEVECGGTVKQDTETAQIISIIYRSFVCGVAVIFGVTFVVYGMKLFLALKKRSKQQDSKVRRKKKTPDFLSSLSRCFYSDQLDHRNIINLVDLSMYLPLDSRGSE